MTVDFGFHYLPVMSGDIRREIYVTGLGRLNYTPGDPYPCEGHPKDYDFRWQQGRILGDFALVLLTRGRGVFEDRILGSTVWKAGEVLILPPGVWHRYQPLKSIGWTEEWLTLNGEFLHRLRAKGFFPRTSLLRQLRDPRAFDSAFSSLWAAPRVNSFQLCSCAFALIACALEGHEVAHRGMEPSRTGDATVDRVLEFIWLNSHRPLNVRSVAHAVGFSRRTLDRQFNDVHVRCVAEEIQWCRVQRASLMLRESQMSVKEIGYAAGFGGSKRLIRTFQRLHGMTPSQFRETE